MNRSTAAPSTPRWGLVAAWLLGITAVLGTLLATAGRVMEARAGDPIEDVARASPEATILSGPHRAVSIRHADAVRTDTFPEVLSAGHAVEIDGGWLLLDPAARRVHVVPDDPAASLRTFGREGDGPGELRQPYRIALSATTIGVVEATGDRLVRFGLDGTVLGPVQLVQPTCGFGPAGALVPVPPASGGGFLVLRSCTGVDGSMRALVLAVASDGRVRVVEDHPLQSLRTGAMDPYATPVIAALDGSVYLGVLSDGCLSRVAGLGEEGTSTSLCAPAPAGIPLPDSVRAGFEALAEKMRRIGGDVAIPDVLPPFTDVRTVRAGIVLQVPLADGRDALDLVESGARRTRFSVDVPGATFIGRRHVLLARALVQGTELTWVEWDG